MSEPSPDTFGPYIVYEQLGMGGMATVHRAETRGIEGFKKRIALKRLLPHLAESAETVESFVHEARLASHLHHPNIAQTYDLGKVDDTYFIAMELVPGPTLLQVIRQTIAGAGAIPVPIVVQIVIQLCEALEYAHGLRDDAGKPLGIIHRDVSPANIIISNSGVVKLIDFGIAKASSGARTQTGLLKGKAGYISPEYTFGKIDARADLFAVGVLMHELLTSRRLFLGKTDFETLMLVRDMPIQPPSRWNANVSRELDAIVMTALERKPELRWQSAGAMRAALAGLAREQGMPVGAPEVIKWVEWAFSQKPKPESSGLGRTLASLEQPSEASIELVAEDLEPSSGVVAAPMRKIDSGAATAVAQKQHQPDQPDQPRWVLVALLLALAAATAAGVYWGLPLLT